MNIATFFNRLGKDQAGATAVEYGLILSLVVLAMLGALQSVANANAAQWNHVRDTSVEVMTN